MKFTSKQIWLYAWLAIGLLALLGGLIMLVPSWFIPLQTFNVFGFSFGHLTTIIGLAIVISSIMMIAKLKGE